MVQARYVCVWLIFCDSSGRQVKICVNIVNVVKTWMWKLRYGVKMLKVGVLHSALHTSQNKPFSFSLPLTEGLEKACGVDQFLRME